jgi:hypothetical protein
VATQAPFSARAFQRLTVFNDKLWMVGGARLDTQPATALNDVWSSIDGTTWVQETQSAAFAGRYNHGLIAFNGRLWVIAGEGQRGAGTPDTHQPLGDVWSSADGKAWQAETSPFGSSPRSNVGVATYGNKLIVSGGRQGSVTLLDLWHTENGQNWTRVEKADFGGRQDHMMVVFRQKLWTLGGGDFVQFGNDPITCCTRNEAWSSLDGLAWTREDPGAPYTPAFRQQMVEFNGRLWMFGSQNSATPDLQAWSSADGNDWVRAPGISAVPARLDFSITVFDQKLWLIGGSTFVTPTTFTDRSDVWSSVDGETWVQATAAGQFGPRRKHSVFVVNDRMFLIGGVAGNTPNPAIWSSADGVTWQLDAANAPFGTMAAPLTARFRGKIWLYGKPELSGDPGGQVWSSLDGLSWVLEKSNELVAALPGPVPVEVNGRLWFAEGYSTEDGVSFSPEDSPAGRLRTPSLGFAAFRNLLWLFGAGPHWLDTPGANSNSDVGQLWRSSGSVNSRVRDQQVIEVP